LWKFPYCQTFPVSASPYLIHSFSYLKVSSFGIDLGKDLSARVSPQRES
jgi:hypothetical protein